MSAPSNDRRSKVQGEEKSPEASHLNSLAPTSPSDKARAFDPLPTPKDLYSRRDQVLTGMNEARELYAKIQEVESNLPNNIVQEIREQMDMQWMRTSDHERTIDKDNNIKTIRELRDENARLREEKARVDGRFRAMTASQQIATSTSNIQDGTRTNTPCGQRRRSGPTADALLSKDTKSWRRQD